MASLLTLHPRREASHRSRSAHRTSTHIPKQAATITVLSPDDVKDLRGRYHTKELVVIGLLDALQLQLYLIVLLNHFLTSCFVGRFDPDILTHLVIECALLLLHLSQKREESGSLLGRQTSFLGDILFQIGLILLRRESLRLLEILLGETLTGETVLRELLPRAVSICTEGT